MWVRKIVCLETVLLGALGHRCMASLALGECGLASSGEGLCCRDLLGRSSGGLDQSQTDPIATIAACFAPDDVGEGVQIRNAVDGSPCDPK